MWCLHKTMEEKCSQWLLKIVVIRMVSMAGFDVCTSVAENSIVLGCDVTSLGDQLMTF